MTSRTTMLTQLLEVWNVITGIPVRMIPSVERSLWEFQKYYTKADLESTLTYIVYKNKRSDRPWHLRFEKFFDDEFKHFESIRAEAEQHNKAIAAKRRQVLPEQSAIELAAMRHDPAPAGPEQPVKRVSTKLLSEAITNLNAENQ